MNISKTSWHYRFIKDSFVGSEIYKPDPVSLCPYVRRLAYVFVVSVFMYSVMAFLASCVVHAIGYVIMGVMFGFGATSGVMTVGIIVSASAVAGGLVVGVIYCFGKMFDKLTGTVQKNQDNIFVAHAKSIHDKVCPTIEFKD